MVKDQITNIESKIEYQKLKKPKRFEKFIFTNIINKISFYALDLILDQYNRMDNIDNCSKTFRSIYGLPCRHEILEKVLSNKNIELYDINKQWYLNYMCDVDYNDKISGNNYHQILMQ